MPTGAPKTAVDIVLIGRNEAARLPAVLSAVAATDARTIYVDSGSTDGSAEIAEAAGLPVLPLDLSVPFTAARARNAGAAAFEAPAPYLHFIDADCVLDPGWMEEAVTFLETHPDHAMVTGWAAEEHPERSVYNRLIDWEWKAPAGRIDASTGNMLVRRAAFDAVGGFDPAFIASEEEDLCLRLIAAGWHLERLPRLMVRHDAAMTRLGQWWRRTERAGHGLAQIAAKHGVRRVRERRRAWVFGLGIPLAALLALAVAPSLSALVLLAYPLIWVRGYRAMRRDGIGARDAASFAGLFTLAKFPTLQGMLRYHARRWSGQDLHLIEYRTPTR
ncbi:N-glycosyltransferase [Roseivivax sp. THAF40]|uniref:glycosyltransferase n=1 Tax=unclassified Roseivivax TaxID=2639302 RepID=UPI0012698245|nr:MULTISPECIES: glycosyltransferase [unclassified Roseivivax]QFS84587.1 N-glycosyltransferase [Roseivivax sp. THAF197b]QFT48414.1 N-glycosyltransferase [Roseivivax sp. THAF40]